MAKKSFELANRVLNFCFLDAVYLALGFAEYGMQAMRILRIRVGAKKNQIP